MNSTNSLDKTIKLNKWSWFFKRGFAVIVVLLLGLVMFLALGFNKSFDYTGGTIVSVNTTTYSASDAKNKVNQTFANYKNANICDINVGKATQSGETVLTIKYQVTGDSATTATTNDAILADLFSQFQYDKTTDAHYITMVTNIEPAYNNSVFTYALLGALLATIACAIYTLLRHGLASAFVLLATTAIDVLCGIAMILIFRANISAYMGYALVSIAIISIMYNMFMLNKLKENSFKEEFKKSPNDEVANATMYALFKPYMLVTLFGLIVLFAVALISGQLAGMATMTIALTLIAVFATTVFVNPSLWAIAYKRHIRQPKKTEAVEVESEIVE